MDHKLLENAPLFKDVPPEEINVMLQCLGTEERDYDKGETIFHAGDVIHNIGLVLTGRVQIENDDVWGNKSVMESVGPGFAFAESYACLPGEPLMVSAIAAEPSHILFLDTGRGTDHLSFCLHPPQPPDPEPVIYLFPEKSKSVQTDLPHLFQIHPWPPVIIPFFSGLQSRQPGFLYSI